jgi:H+/Cl- antiporter ClcA
MSAIRKVAKGLWDVSRKGPVLEEAQRFLLLSIVIGIFAGLVVVCFHISIEFLNWNTIHSLGGLSDAWRVVWPALGGGAAYLLVYFVFPTARGTGVAC